MVFNFIKSSYQKLKTALTKTRSFLGDRLRSLFGRKIDETVLGELEQLFYEADLGPQTAIELTQKVKDLYAQNPEGGSDFFLNAIREELASRLARYPSHLHLASLDQGPTVILIVGVNGNGKTTSVAKLAKFYRDQGKEVLLAAGDTFRAAAMEQLEIWAERVGAQIVRGNASSDPAAVVFDAITAAKARKSDIVIIDTAGRLHTKTHLMQELAKIRRTCGKVHSGSPHETLLVLDATTGQNAIDQARIFHEFTPVTGLILTKLDGTAKGGIVLSICQQLGIPVKFIGVGEGLEDLQPFDPSAFAQALFE